MVRIPSLDALRIFVVAARHMSFTNASKELCLTQSAVSHRIRALEEELGFALFDRLTRRLELTPQGRVLAQKLDEAIGHIDRGIVEIAKHEDAGPLKVTMLPSVASRWLIPRLTRMRSRSPGLDVQVIAEPRSLDLRAESIDLAIRFCRAPHPSYAATRLMGDSILPVCALDLLRQFEPVDSIDALLALPLLHDSSTNADCSDSSWRAWLDHFGRRDIDYHAGQHFSEAGMTVDAAVLELGVAMARASLVAERLASGALICPLGLAVPTAFTYYLLALPEAVGRPKIALLHRLLVAEATTTKEAMRSIGLLRPRPVCDNRIFAAAA